MKWVGDTGAGGNIPPSFTIPGSPPDQVLWLVLEKGRWRKPGPCSPGLDRCRTTQACAQLCRAGSGRDGERLGGGSRMRLGGPSVKMVI